MEEFRRTLLELAAQLPLATLGDTSRSLNCVRSVTFPVFESRHIVYAIHHVRIKRTTSSNYLSLIYVIER